MNDIQFLLSFKVVVGWFVVGRSVLTPSVRHVAIHRALCESKLVQPLMNKTHDLHTPSLYFLSAVISSAAHCTKSMEFQVLTNLQSDSLTLSPVELKVSNLVNDSYSEYEKFSSVGSLSFTMPSPVTFPPEHIVNLEQSFQGTIESLLAKLDRLEKEEQENELQRLENKKLAMQLAERDEIC
jgi:hypothetical protein